MKKVLDSDWLRAVQFKCNTGTKSATPECKLHIVILKCDLLKDNGKCSKPMLSSKTMTKISKKVSQLRKKGFKKDLLTLPPYKFFMLHLPK